MLENVENNSSAVSAIIGGVLGQEILKSISRNTKPFKNWLFYGPLVGDAAVVVDLK